MILDNARYTQEHEWVIIEDDIATIGITTYAVEELGDVVFVELPNADVELSQSDEFGSIESVKTVSSLFMPISGVVLESNTLLTNNPEMVNESPYSDGWLIKVKPENLTEFDDLMTSEEYESYLASL
jgi:glycine cleavage system H protein